MPEMFSLTTKQRDELLDDLPQGPRPRGPLPLPHPPPAGRGHAWDTIEAMLFCSSRTVDRWLKRFRAEGVAGLTGRKRGRPFRLGLGWVAVLVTWVTTKTPGDFGFLRSRWSCDAAGPLAPRAGRRRRPAGRPSAACSIAATWSTAGPGPSSARTRRSGRPSWPSCAGSWKGCPPTRRRSGRTRSRSTPTPRSAGCGCSRASRRRSRRRGPTRSGTSSGSIHWRTGQVFVTEGGPEAGPRHGALFIKHLDDLRRRLRRYKKVHVICDNASATPATR